MKLKSIFIAIILILIIVISYIYYSLTPFNISKYITDQKKSLLEKQGSKALEQIEEFKDKIEKNSQALSKKDSEIDELNTKLSSKDQEYSKINTDLTELKEKLVNNRKNLFNHF